MGVIIPAIDLRDGRCVRLVQGRADEQTVYSDDPVAVAREFAAGGAQRLHVVDLDGAFDGLPRNLETVQRIAQAIDIPVQMGGGIRTLAAIERVLESGIQWVILGTVAIEQPDIVAEACRLYPGRIIVGLDAREGRVAVRGWTEGTDEDALAVARRMKDVGVREIVFTDIAKDGMLQGPNLDALRTMAEGSGLKVIASGGVTTRHDVAAVARIADVSGMIIGKALYEGNLTLTDALAAREEVRSTDTVVPTAARATASPAARLVVCLDVKDGRVVKGVQFADVQDVGDPAQLAAHYDAEGADELILLDIGATAGNRDVFIDLIKRVKAKLTIPLTVGGGIDSVEYMGQLLDAGADKLSISSAAVRRPQLLTEGAEKYGSERIVLAVDCRRRTFADPSAGWEVVVDGGRTGTDMDAVEWAVRGEALGAGELMLNSIDADGMQRGCDNVLNKTVADRVDIPVIASGGVGNLADIRDAFFVGRVDAVLAASIFHFGHMRIEQAKQFLHAAGVPVGLKRGLQHGTD